MSAVFTSASASSKALQSFRGVELVSVTKIGMEQQDNYKQLHFFKRDSICLKILKWSRNLDKFR